MVGKKLVKIQYISLVNLILQQNAVSELIQEDCTVANMHTELQKLLPGKPQRQAQLAKYADLQALLQESGVSERVANSMNTYLSS